MFPRESFLSPGAPKLIAKRFTGVMSPGALYMVHFPPAGRGMKTVVHWIGLGQTHPELASGIITSPFAGMQLIQQPGLWPPKCTVPESLVRS
jgi:hypothetical protein